MDDEDEVTWGDLTEEQQFVYVQMLAEKFNSMQAVAIDLFNCLTIWSTELKARDVFGDRHQAMASMHQRMDFIQAMALPHFNLDLEQMQADAEFEDIISRMEDDD